MKIERMNKGSWGKVRAFFDLSTKEGFTIKGFKLIEGINGLFVSNPSQKGNDNEYYDTIWIDSKELREQLNQLAINTYNEGMSSGMNQESSQVENFDQTVGENLSENSATQVAQEEKETVSTQSADTSFNEDDIPF
tara:strand:+ start:369 stop:776 length:408 start_codon:yes stop_codon:yes gene_type:complete